MKRAIICIFIFAALCGIAAGSYIYIADSTARLLNKVELVIYNFADGEFEAALLAADEANEIWAAFRKHRYLIIDRDNVAEITVTLARIRTYAAEENPELFAEGEAAAALLRHYIENQRVNIYNIL